MAKLWTLNSQFCGQLLLLSCFIVDLVNGDDQCKVTTKSGPIQGNLVDVLEKKICVFYGIPFAKPPIGELRFKKPIAIEPWTDELKCDQAKPHCPQIKKNLKEDLKFDLEKELDGKEIVGGALTMMLEMQEFEMSEDCLYMNIYTPADIAADKKYAMMIYFHPGWFFNGGASMKSFDPSILVAQTDLVIAIPQYRLGMLGYFYCGIPESPGNVGLWDQREAISWFKANAEVFGGDPETLTLMGQGSGGWSAGFHSVAVASEGLAKRAIMQSGTALNLLMFFGNNSACFRCTSTLKVAGCPVPTAEGEGCTRPEAAGIDCLRKKTVEELLDLQQTILTTRKDMGFTPNEDEEFFGANPFDKLKEGTVNLESMIMGSTSNEGGIIYSSAMGKAAPMFKGEPESLTLNDMIALMKEKSDGPSGSQIQMILPMFYRGLDKNNGEEVRNRTQQLISDGLIVCPNQMVVTSCAKSANCKVFYYYFDHRTSNAVFADWLAGAQHYEEIQYIFGYPFIKPDKYSKEEQELSKLIMSSWSNFAKTGNPSIGKPFVWKVTAGKSKYYNVITDKGIKAVKGFPKNNCKDLVRYYGMGRSFLKNYNPDKKKE